jgi:hypothetical protein
LHTQRAVLCIVAALAGWSTAATSPLPDAGAFECERAYLGECDYVDRASGLLFNWPTDWPVRRLRLDTVTGPAANARQSDALRWLAVEYLPDDAAQPEVSLFQVAVLRRADWVWLSNRAWTVSGVEVAANSLYVAVASVPPVNPYPPGSRDAEIFEALLPTYADISRIVRLPAQPRPAR